MSRGILNLLPPDLLSVIGSIDGEEHTLSAKLGVIEEGACADIVLVYGISLKDITVLEARPKVLEGTPMNEVFQKFFLLIAVIHLLFSGCATTPTLITITETSGRITRYGYSILPPQEKGWRIIKLNEEILSLAMSGNNIDESYVIVVKLEKLNLYEITGKNNIEKLVNYIKSIKPNGITSNRFKILSYSILPYSLRKEQCIITYLLAEDYAATKKLIIQARCYRVLILYFVSIHILAKL